MIPIYFLALMVAPGLLHRYALTAARIQARARVDTSLEKQALRLSSLVDGVIYSVLGYGLVSELVAVTVLLNQSSGWLSRWIVMIGLVSLTTFTVMGAMSGVADLRRSVEREASTDQT